MIGAGRRAMLALWRSHMNELGLRDPGDAVGRRLVARYGAVWRRYHSLDHLAFLLGEIDRRAEDITDRPRLLLAAWFHDAIQVGWRKDDEARSARWAERALPALGADEALTRRVGDLIRRTADHRRGGDDDDALFLDMDLAILGAPDAVYDRYAARIRQECWWVPPKVYRRRRAAILRDFLARTPLFLTQAYEARLGEQARMNMRRELNRLRRP